MRPLNAPLPCNFSHYLQMSFSLHSLILISSSGGMTDGAQTVSAAQTNGLTAGSLVARLVVSVRFGNQILAEGIKNSCKTVLEVLISS